MLQRCFHKLSDLSRVRRNARARWRAVLFTVIVLVVANIAAAVFLQQDHPPTEISGVVLVTRDDVAGTGFFVSNKYVFSAAHVVGDVGNSVTISSEDGLLLEGEVVASGYPEYAAYADSPTEADNAIPHDWALIEASQPVPDMKSLLCGSVLEATEMSPVMIVGHPQAGPRTYSNGIISRIEEDRVMTNSPIDHGFSGGPMILLYDEKDPEKGVVIGIISGAPVGYETLNTAVALDVVLERCYDLGLSPCNP